jgi:hypothetical protein
MEGLAGCKGPDAGFYALSEQYPELAGKAFWKFISKQYGNGMVKNLLYSMQQKTGVKQGNEGLCQPTPEGDQGV